MRAFFVSLCVALSFTARAEEGALDEVVVNASRYNSEVSVATKISASKRRIPASVSTLTDLRLEEQNLTTLAEALTQVTGVTVVPNDGLQSQYRSRGYLLSVMNDGVPAYSSFSGYQQFDAEIYERIEVVRGPNGLLTGVAEPAGAVNLVSKRGSHSLSAEASGSLSSWEGRRLTVDAGGPFSERLRARAVGVFDERGHFTHGMETQRRLGYTAIDWDLSAKTSMSATGIYQQDDASGGYSGLPAYESGAFLALPRTARVTPAWSRTSWRTNEFSAMVSHEIAARWRLIVRGWTRDQDLFFFDAQPIDGVRASDMTLPYGRRRFEYEYARSALDAFISGELSLFGRQHSLVLGYNYDRFDQQFAGINRFSAAQAIRVPLQEVDQVMPLDSAYDQGGRTEQTQSGFYTQARLSVSNSLALFAGARLSDFEARTRAESPSTPTNWRALQAQTGEVTPMGGILFDATRWLSLYASYAESFVPQSTLLKANNQPLNPRVGRQYEIGAKAEWFGSGLQASAAVFDLRDLGRSLADTANPGFFLNAGEVQSKGWELEVVGVPLPNIELQFGYSRLDAKFLEGTAAQVGQRFSLQEPKHSWRAWVVRRSQPGDSSGWSLGLGFTAQSGIADPPRVQGSYAIANAMLGYRFSERLAVTLNGNNLFDRAHYTRIGGVNIYNTYGAPRNFAFALRARY